MTGTGADERRAAVEAGLTPIVRIAGHPTHWTVDERLAHYECPGVAVAVMHEGRIDWAAGYGRRNVDAPESVGADTLFMVASCSKPVAAVLVLQQVLVRDMVLLVVGNSLCQSAQPLLLGKTLS